MLYDDGGPVYAPHALKDSAVASGRTERDAIQNATRWIESVREVLWKELIRDDADKDIWLRKLRKTETRLADATTTEDREEEQDMMNFVQREITANAERREHATVTIEDIDGLLEHRSGSRDRAAKEILRSADCGTGLYHVTYTANLKTIAEHGLIPDQPVTFTAIPDNHLRGRIFFAVGLSAAKSWAEAIPWHPHKAETSRLEREELRPASGGVWRTKSLSLIRVTPSRLKYWLKHLDLDTIGSEQVHPCSFYVLPNKLGTTGIPAADLEVSARSPTFTDEGGLWTPLVAKGSASRTYPCNRCQGHGTIQGFSHVIGGVCFKCNGTGTQESKPSTKSVLWSVHLPKIVERPTCFTGEDFIYNEKAKTAAQAIRMASVTFKRTTKLQREATLDGAWAEPQTEYLTRMEQS